MRIRSAEELETYLDEELSWRKKELTTARFVWSSGRVHEKKVLYRAGVCLLYAHWEGFVKQASQAYLTLVNKSGLKVVDASDRIVALAFRDQLRQAGTAGTQRLASESVVGPIRSGGSVVEVPAEFYRNLRQNVDFELLCEVLCVAGADTSTYATKEAQLNHKLLASRNKVAHGERHQVSEEDYDELHETVLGMLESVRDDIAYCARAESFRRKA